MPGFHNQYSASAFIDFVSFKNEIKKKKYSIFWTSCFDLYEPPDSVMYVPVLLKPLQCQNKPSKINAYFIQAQFGML